MENKEINIAIAELRGYRKLTIFTQHPKSWGGNPARYYKPIWKMTLRDDIEEDECYRYGWHGNGSCYNVMNYIPDYCADANATQDIIDSFTRKQTISYISHLYDIVGGTMDDAVVASRKDKALAIWKTLKEEYERTKI